MGNPYRKAADLLEKRTSPEDPIGSTYLGYYIQIARTEIDTVQEGRDGTRNNVPNPMPLQHLDQTFKVGMPPWMSRSAFAHFRSVQRPG